MGTTRAKFNLTAIKNDDGSMQVSGTPVVTGSEENKSFAEYTPSGTFHMHISPGKPAQENFKEGMHEYYLDIVPAN